MVGYAPWIPLALHGAGEVDIIAQGEFLLGDDAYLPIEGLGGERTLRRTVAVDVYHYRRGVGVIEESPGVYNAVNKDIRCARIYEIGESLSAIGAEGDGLEGLGCARAVPTSLISVITPFVRSALV